MMWYGVLGTKELLQRTYKNLEQKVQLEVRENTLTEFNQYQYLSLMPIVTYRNMVMFTQIYV